MKLARYLCRHRIDCDGDNTVYLTHQRTFPAALDGKGYVRAADQERVMRPEAWVRGVSGADVVRQCLSAVPTPASLTAHDLARLRGPAA